MRQLGIHLDNQIGHQFAVVHFVGAFHTPIAFTPDGARTYEERMHGRFKLVGGEAEHVGVHILIEHNRVLLHHSAEHLDVVTQPRRTLEIEVGARLLHLRGELGDVRFAHTAGQYAYELFAHAPVRAGVDTTHAWR